MAIEVRAVRDDELSEAGRVTALAYREFVRPGESDWESYLERIADVGARRDRALVLVAVDGEAVLGSATLELGDRIEDEEPPLAADEAHIRMLGVDPAARRRGVARALMDACEAAALEAGRSRITLHTTQRMRAAQTMYEAMGFERLADRVFPDGFVLLTYRRILPSAPGATRGRPDQAEG